MRTICLTIGFDGTEYHGYQIQRGKRTVQGTLQQAVRLVLPGTVSVTGCGRTDAGVHAQVYYVRVVTQSEMPLRKIPLALTANLPDDITVYRASEMPADFHPRYSMQSKEYTYRIWNRRTRNPFLLRYAYHVPRAVNREAMRLAARGFLGTHDFRCCQSAGSDQEDTVRTIYECELTERGDLLELRIRGSGFLYNMVRIIAGTVLEAGLGRMDPAAVATILAGGERAQMGPTLPAHGLAMTAVTYKEGFVP
ncbi:tRNA pseudouridine(38-40) synthase TruA [Feifania hominis]|uniref:tRNA pseudouridine synthase A n=1 Tax=Feifania hominis TaxID=2763660 RepID=A0A926HTM6_9FIRM|nr:tRNA pseudouridine(38-40) synthase TruA [Feifania hominis]MBC8535458.1 tRNA pseudouridine(38-40) synthase TruA [Feifania hominis]